MLRYGRNDRNMNLGIAGIPKGVKAATPGSNISERGESHQSDETNTKSANDERGKEGLELLARDGRSDILNEADELKEAKDA